VKLPEEAWIAREGVAELLRALEAPEGRTRFVGGMVRDTLLGLPVSDFDLATRLQPPQVLERLKRSRIKAVPTGLAHGTVTAVLSSGPIEVTTLRRDVSTDGRRATVAFTDDWQEDAARRDFTINALSADPGSGEIHDYFAGLADLEARRVRFIGDPLTRIAEDHLRILRFFRFHARFGEGPPDPEGLAACAVRANDLMALSRERIADELIKLLAMEDPNPTTALMIENGIFRPVIPEIDLQGCGRLRELVERERAAGVGPEAIRRLAALLPPDPELSASVAARLRLSKKDAKRLVSAARRSGAAAEPRTLAYMIGTEEAVDRLLLAEDEAPLTAEKVKPLLGWVKPRFPLTGGQLIEMGLKPGPQVAKTLQAIEGQWVAERFPDEERVRKLAREEVDQLLRSSQ
jgi:poly(A) polymerase